MKHKHFAIAASTLTIACHQPAVFASAELEPVVVSANQSPLSLSSVTAKTSVITQTEIEEKQFSTLKDALNSVPGLHIYSSGGALLGSNLQMRGSRSNQVLIMIDGTAINDPSSLGGNIDNLSLQDVYQIEVIKSPMAGVWGANAAAGIINIITKSAANQADAQNGSFYLEKGSFNSLAFGTSLSAKQEQGDFLISLNQKSADGYSAIITDKDQINKGEEDGYQQTDILFKMGINLATKHRLETTLKSTQTKTDYDATIYDFSTFSLTTNPDDEISSNDLQSTLKKLAYQYDGKNFDLQAFISRFDMDRVNTQPFDTGIYKGSILQRGVSSQIQYREQDVFGLGIANQKVYAKSEFYGENDAEYQSTGLLLTNLNHFNDGKLVFSQSLRSDTFDNDFKDKVTGNIGFKNHFTPDIYLGGQLGSAYITPSLYDYTHALSKLQPETFEGYEINFGAYGLEFSFYENEVSDLIQYHPTSYLAYNIEGKSKLKGFEITYGRYIEALTTQLSLSYEGLSVKDANNEWLGRRPESQAAMSLSYDGIANTVIGLDIRYTGTMYDQNDQQGLQIGEYTVSDLTMSYDLDKHFTLYARVNNLTDEHFVSGTPLLDNPPGFVYNSGGRQLYIGLRGQF